MVVPVSLFSTLLVLQDGELNVGGETDDDISYINTFSKVDKDLLAVCF